MSKLACFTADVEQDCPPYLETTRGMSEGMPRLLDLLGELGVHGTFFTTGEMARQFPAIMRRVVDEGHELACHGDLHLDFTTLTRDETVRELSASTATLRAIAPVVSFRAPYLRYPAAHLPLLVEHGLRIDSSVALYKSGSNHRLGISVPGLTRVPASATSSVLRLPALVRAPWLRALKSPVMLFVHPWEAVDFTRSNLRLDCRFRTGPRGVAAWREVILQVRGDGAEFRRLDEIAREL